MKCSLLQSFYLLSKFKRNLIRIYVFICLLFLFFYNEKDKKSLIDELETTKNQFSECNNELVRLQELVEHLQNEKNKLNRRISKLVHNGKLKKNTIRKKKNLYFIN